jgi:hypothetical protein
VRSTLIGAHGHEALGRSRESPLPAPCPGRAGGPDPIDRPVCADRAP